MHLSGQDSKSTSARCHLVRCTGKRTSVERDCFVPFVPATCIGSLAKMRAHRRKRSSNPLFFSNSNNRFFFSSIMDFQLKCNLLKCRRQLTSRAVVTTCSHIFCLQCANATGLSNGNGVHRQCPACSTKLDNPDDAAETELSPTEDYKTSILSGLSPTVIMECASRGLAFYSYQTTQEMSKQPHLDFIHC